MAKAKYKRNNRGVFETKIWDGTYNSNGTKHRKIISTKKSSAELERLVNDFKHAVAHGENTISTEDDFVTYAKQWLELKKGVREKNTKIMYERIINKHLNFLENVKLCNIRNSHFQIAINNAYEHPRTCQQIYITFNQIIKQAATDGYITKAMQEKICSDISLPKYIKTEKRALTDIEKAAIQVADFTPREKAFVYLIYGCGLRRGEALALSPFDFKFSPNENTVSINKATIFVNNDVEIKPIPKSDNGIRTLPIPTAILPFIKEYVKSCKGECILQKRAGGLMTKSSYDKMWASIVKKINIAAGGTPNLMVIFDLTAHIFRHNYCTNLCYQIPNISIRKIAQLMGDTEKMVMEVYNHIMEEREDAVSVLEDALSFASPTTFNSDKKIG